MSRSALAGSNALHQLPDPGEMVGAVVLALEAVIHAIHRCRRDAQIALARIALDLASDPAVEAPDLLQQHHGTLRTGAGNCLIGVEGEAVRRRQFDPLAHTRSPLPSASGQQTQSRLQAQARPLHGRVKSMPRTSAGLESRSSERRRQAAPSAHHPLIGRAVVESNFPSNNGTARDCDRCCVRSNSRRGISRLPQKGRLPRAGRPAGHSLGTTWKGRGT